MPPHSNETAAIPMPATKNMDGITKLMKSEGPIVDAVLLSVKDGIKDIRVDTTPQKQMVSQILGGPFTFLGQYEDEGLMLMIRRDPDSSLMTNPHTHKLQPPFRSTEVKGDILVIKVAPETPEDEKNAQDPSTALLCLSKSNDEFFLSYTKAEYEKFAARTDVVAPTMQEEAMTSEQEDAELSEEEEEEMEGEDDSDDEDDGGFVELFMGQVLQRFEQENGRKPNDEELKALQSAISEKLVGLTA